MSSGPVMSLVYLFLKALVKLILRVFYPDTTVIGKERLKFKEPAIVISNHPNTLMDPLQVASRTRKQVFFLANAGLFQSKFTNWLFNTLYCIPIKRKQDGAGQGVRNEDSFARCDEFLGAGGVLFIAPEGGSEMERRLRPFKTGTARIAISAEQKKDFQLGLIILPIGIHYDQPTRFGSKCVINVGQPIRVSDWQTAYAKDPQEMVRDLTDHLENQTRTLVIDTKDAEQGELHRQLENLMRNERPLSVIEDFKRSQQLANNLKAWEAGRPAEYDILKKSSQAYNKMLNQYGISDAAVKNAPASRLQSWFYLILGFPIFLYGAIHHLLAAGIPALVARKVDVYIGYQATVKALVALISFPLFYWLQFKVVGWFFASPIPWLYLLSLPVSALLAWKYWVYWQKAKNQQLFRKLLPEIKKQLIQERASILNYLDYPVEAKSY